MISKIIGLLIFIFAIGYSVGIAQNEKQEFKYALIQAIANATLYAGATLLILKM